MIRPILHAPLWRGFLLVAFGLTWPACQRTTGEAPLTDCELVGAWADMTLYITKNTPANSPTYASRCLGYIGLTMYESVVPGFPEYNSLAGQLNGLDSLPVADSRLAYNWQLSLNAGQAAMLRSLYNQTSDENKAKIDSLEQALQARLTAGLADRGLVDRSAAFGRSVADRIFTWSRSDGGHRGYLQNFDKTLRHPEHPGAWKPPLFAQSFSHHPLHPHWGRNRTFLEADARLAAPAFIPFDTAQNSQYYRQFLAVCQKEPLLTREEKEIAIWWADDPDVTFTPPGHSYYIATLLIRDKKPDLIQCARTCAGVGMAVADAFINCWKWKYQFFSERPNTYVTEHIDQRWESFWPDPPFPAFPSGHAIQGAAAARVLIGLYGDSCVLTDRAHAGRERDEVRNVDFKERPITSLWAMAEEIAQSRFYGGIHTPQDNAAGLEAGSRIAENINALSWKKNKR